MARYPLAIKIANLFVYIFLLGANVYSGLGPDNGDSPYHDKHPTHISPAPFAFGVWGLIHFLLGGFVIYQFFGSHDLIVEGINWHFVSITLFNALWLALWQADYPILAWFAIILTSGQISFVYTVVKRFSESGTAHLNEVIWVHAPFSLYHAWIFVIFVVSTFAAFAPDKVEGESPNLLIKILVFFGLLFLQLTAVGYIKFNDDIGGAIVIAWALYGIAAEQEDLFIHWSALVLAILTSLHIFVPITKKLFNRGDSRNEETAPILG